MFQSVWYCKKVRPVLSDSQNLVSIKNKDFKISWLVLCFSFKSFFSPFLVHVADFTVAAFLNVDCKMLTFFENRERSDI